MLAIQSIAASIVLVKIITLIAATFISTSHILLPVTVNRIALDPAPPIILQFINFYVMF